jgi:hypothetical protein
VKDCEDRRRIATNPRTAEIRPDASGLGSEAVHGHEQGAVTMGAMAALVLSLTAWGAAEEPILSPQTKAEIESRKWTVGQELWVVLPVQTGTAYLWDLEQARCEGDADQAWPAARLLTSFDNPRLRAMTPEEQQRYGSGDGPLGGNDRMQMIRVRLERPGVAHLIFRKYRAFDRKRSDAQRDRFEVRLEIGPASERTSAESGGQSTCAV